MYIISATATAEPEAVGGYVWPCACSHVHTACAAARQSWQPYTLQVLVDGWSGHNLCHMSVMCNVCVSYMQPWPSPPYLQGMVCSSRGITGSSAWWCRCQVGQGYNPNYAVGWMSQAACLWHVHVEAGSESSSVCCCRAGSSEIELSKLW